MMSVDLIKMNMKLFIKLSALLCYPLTILAAALMFVVLLWPLQFWRFCFFLFFFFYLEPWTIYELWILYFWCAGIHYQWTSIYFDILLVSYS